MQQRVMSEVASVDGTMHQDNCGQQGIARSTLITLAMLAAVTPFTTDFYLPAFPQIAHEFGAAPDAVQLTLTAFLIGTAVGQLLFGPISDRCGRVKPILVGTLLCAFASAAAAWVPSLLLLTLARFVQGLSGSAGMVVGRAMISDLAQSREEASRAFNLLIAVVGIAPIVAPWLGSVLVAPIGWRGTLWVVTGIMVLLLVLSLVFLHESHPAQCRSVSSGLPLWSQLASRRFWGCGLIFGLAFATFMAYISASPFLFQSMIGLSVRQYGLVFALITIMLTGASVVSAQLLGRIPAFRQLGRGVLALLLCCGAEVALVVLHLPALWLILPITLAVTSLGFILGNATSSAIHAVPRAAGAASAVIGALQFGLSALAAPLVGLCGEASALPMALVMAVGALLSVGCYLLAASGASAEQARPC